MISSGVHHVSLNVDDLDACRRFYVDGFGMTEIDRPDLGFPGAWLAVGEHEIHLLQGSPPPALGQHYSLRVDDLDATLSTLAERGIEIDRMGGIEGVCRQAFLSDPSGNTVELTQPV